MGYEGAETFVKDSIEVMEVLMNYHDSQILKFQGKVGKLGEYFVEKQGVLCSNKSHRKSTSNNEKKGSSAEHLISENSSLLKANCGCPP